MKGMFKIFLIIWGLLSFGALAAIAQPYDLGYEEKGVASYYANKFHGRKTASGEKYNKQDLTAAHRKLPFNSLVKVTNLANGQSIVVRINDRGPYTKGRILDVSLKGAEALGMIQQGTAKIALEVVGKPGDPMPSSSEEPKETKKRKWFFLKKRPAKRIEIPTNKPTPEVKRDSPEGMRMGQGYGLDGKEVTLNGFGVQLAAYQSLEMAKTKGQEAEQKGLTPIYIVPVAQGVNTLYRVFCEHQAEEKDLRKILELAKKSGFPQAFIKQH